ncbi:putative tetratricopeptide-like helical domain superfamily [Helianthus debilis subsp. tardiflorus]
MTEKGVLADVITYSSLIQGLCNFGRETEAARMLMDMEGKGVSPSVVTFNILVDSFCKKGSVKDAELAVQAMVRSGGPRKFSMGVRNIFKNFRPLGI